MTNLKRCGFFKDIPLGDEDGPLLREAVSSKPPEDEARAVSYLQAGALLAFSPAVVRDALSKDQLIIGPLKLLTDGEWVWRSDLAYYVENYHYQLPEEFVRHMRSRDWKPPSAEEIDLDALTL
jgi:hypothetical protein